MSNNQKNDILELEEMMLLSEDTVIKKSLLIKHDYYSTDNDHGRYLLKNYISSIDWTTINNVFMLDSSVKLLNDSSFIFSIMASISNESFIYVCKESIDYYKAQIVENDHIIIIDSSSIISEIQNDSILTIE